MWTWSKRETLEWEYSDWRVDRLRTHLISPFPILRDYTGFFSFTVDGVMSEIQKWFCTSSTRICCSLYLSYSSFSLMPTVASLSSMIGTWHSTICSSQVSHLVWKPLLTRTFTTLNFRRTLKQASWSTARTRPSKSYSLSSTRWVRKPEFLTIKISSPGFWRELFRDSSFGWWQLIVSMALWCQPARESISGSVPLSCSQEFSW